MAIVKMTAEARQQMLAMPKEVRSRIRDALERLKKWPTVSGVKRLTGNLAGFYRMRVGDYRMRFRIEGETLTVDKIGHRKDVYED